MKVPKLGSFLDGLHDNIRESELSEELADVVNKINEEQPKINVAFNKEQIVQDAMYAVNVAYRFLNGAAPRSIQTRLSRNGCVTGRPAPMRLVRTSSATTESQSSGASVQRSAVAPRILA